MYLKFLRNIIVFICCIQQTFCYIGRTAPSVHPDYPNKCWSDITSKAYGPHEYFQPADRCERYTCIDNYSFHILGCNKLDYVVGYHQEMDLSKEFPDCCPELVEDETRKP